MQQYVKNGSRAIRGRVFPEYVCIEDVDKIISSVQRAPEEAAGRSETGKHSTASENRFTPIDKLTASAKATEQAPRSSFSNNSEVTWPACHASLKKNFFFFLIARNIRAAELQDHSNNSIYTTTFVHAGLNIRWTPFKHYSFLWHACAHTITSFKSLADLLLWCFWTMKLRKMSQGLHIS